VRAPNPNDPQHVVRIKIFELLDASGGYNRCDIYFSDLSDFFVEWGHGPAGRIHCIHHLDERPSELPPGFVPLSEIGVIPDDRVFDVLDDIIRYLGIFVDNNLIKSSKELWPGNLFFDGKTFEVAIGFPLCRVSYGWLWDGNEELDYLAPELSVNWAHFVPKAYVWNFGLIAARQLPGGLPDAKRYGESGLTFRLMVRKDVLVRPTGGVAEPTVDIIKLIVDCMNPDPANRSDFSSLVREWICF
jgi:hypothetical protein